MFNKKNKKLILKGISLVETMVALGILLVGILSSYFLLMRALSSYRFIEDRLVAANLAQEKIEEIRQIRDNNYANWYNEVVQQGSRNWQWNRNINCNYIQCSESNLLNKFQRITNINYRQNNKEIVINVTVNWQTRGQDFSYQAESHLFDWANLPPTVSSVSSSSIPSSSPWNNIINLFFQVSPRWLQPFNIRWR